MILQALKEYYDRKSADPTAGIAPHGWEWKEIPYVIVLKPDGMPTGIECTYEGKGRARRAKRYLVPQAVKRTIGIAANLLWDTPEYVLGVVQPGKKRSKNKSEAQIRQRVAEQHAAFKERIATLGVDADTGLGAVRAFLGRKDLATALAQFGESWTDLLVDGANVSFRLAGATGLVSDSLAVKNAATEGSDVNGKRPICLVTGVEDAIKNLHDPIKNVWGGQTSGTNIVSFNHDSFCSYGKKQGANAPIGNKAADAYTKALNDMLGKDPQERMRIGDASTVFWSAQETAFERQVVNFFIEPPKNDPGRNTRAVESLFNAPNTGALSSDNDTTRFYVLGLAPNGSRLAVRFWIVGSVAEMSTKLRQHFQDIEIGLPERHSNEYARSWPTLSALLASTANETKKDIKKPNLIYCRGKYYDIKPNLEGDAIRAVLEGGPYPETLLQSAIRRIRAEQSKKSKQTGKSEPCVTHDRAALIKACINRKTRNANPTEKEELKVSLDYNNENPGYRLGRLFATLEKIQSEASPGINATIRDRFYGAASCTPITVFGNLMRLKNHHIAKLKNEGRRVYFEKWLGEIIGGRAPLPQQQPLHKTNGIADFPAHLTLADQGRFAIGYYHQMQAFFNKADLAGRPAPTVSTTLVQHQGEQ